MLVSLTAIAAVAVGFALLVWGADRFVLGASATASNLGVSPMVIGLTIVGFGTSAPEMLVSGVAAWTGNPGMAVGNAIGSNIANMGLVLGAAALVAPMTVQSTTLKREFPIMFAVMLFALMLLVDGELGWSDGVLLLTGLVVMITGVVSLGLRRDEVDPMAAEYDEEIPHDLSTAMALTWLVLGLGVLLLSSRMLVWGAVDIAQALGVSDLVIGLTIVAIGTSLPELAASVMAALKKEHDIAIGNVIGSNMFNLLAVLGLPGVIHPHLVDPQVLERDYPVMIGFTVALFVMAYGFRGVGRINRFEGGVLLAAYAGYLILLYFNAS